MRLTVQQIVEVALKLLNEVGLDGLTTRRLAEELNVKGPALYYHFRNKSDLLGHLAAAMMSETMAVVNQPSQDWAEWLRRHAIATRATLLKYRDGARIFSASKPDTDMRNSIIPALVRKMCEAGFSESDAREATAIMAMFVIGYTINEQNPDVRELMASNFDVENGFIAGVESLIIGMKQRYTQR